MILWRWFGCLVGIVVFITVSDAQEPKLTIPGPAERRPALGENLFLECTISPVNMQIVNNVKWLDPQNREIDAATGPSRIYTEVIEGKGRLLFIQTSEEKDAGKYTCEAEFPGNPTLQSSIAITFYQDITFVDAPAVQNPIAGQDALIKCIVKGNPPPFVDWRKDGSILSTSDVNGQSSRFSQENDGLKIKKFGQDDDGVYQCRARVRETGGLKFVDIRVEVHIPPKFIDEPTEQRKVEGETITLICRASGKPSPQYTWTRRLEGQNFEELPTDRFSVDQKTGTLLIRELQHKDKGFYQCRAWNAAGDVTAGAELFVILKPKIVELKNITGEETKRSTMTCEASGEPTPTLRWQKVGSPTPFVGGIQSNDPRIVITTDNSGIAHLTINPLYRQDDGLYLCTATNEGGETHQNGHITVQYRPNLGDKTPTLSYFTWLGNPINITCIAQAIPNATITWSRVSDMKIKDNPNFNTFGGLSISRLQVNPVDDSYFGVYMCSAENNLGDSELSIELKQAVPPGIIDNVYFKLVTATTITFEFDGPREDGGRPILGYDVTYYKDGIGLKAAQSRFLSVGNPYIVDNLEPEQVYYFTFAAKNDVGIGPIKHVEPHRMPAIGPPLSPTILSSNISEHANKYSLQWVEPSSNGADVIRYNIRYWRVQLQPHGQPIKVGTHVETSKADAPAINKWLENLEPLTSYKVEIRAENALGDSMPATIIFTTSKGVGNGRVKLATGSGNNGLTSGAVVGIVIAVILVLLLIVDISCYTMYQCGVLMFLCIKVCGKQPPAAKAKEVAMEEGKTGKEKEPIKEDVNEKDLDEKQEEQDEEKEASEDTPMIEGNEKEKEAYEKEVTVDNIGVEVKDKPTEA